MSHDWSRNVSLRSDLRAAIAGDAGGDRRVDVVCTHNEINDRHGTGILVDRLFQRPGPPVMSVRAQSEWGGEQEFGVERLEIPRSTSRREIYSWMLDRLSGRSVRHVHCIPWGEPEIHAALAVHDAYQAPFCLYIMDDQNVVGGAIPDHLMAEAIDKATLRLAISSDMRDAYEAKYNRRFWLAPPTIPDRLKPVASVGHRGCAVIIGNIWGQEWVDALTGTIRSCRLRVDWFCNDPRGGAWIDPGSLRELQEAGVTLCDPLPPTELVTRLPEYEAALMPTVPRLGRRQNLAVASLSLPSRVPLLIGAGDLPIIVLGDPDTCVARFVDHFGVGTTCAYHGDALLRALAAMRDEAWRQQQHDSLARLRPILGNTDIAAWVQSSLAHGQVVNPVFEALTVEPPRYVRHYVPDTSRTLGPWLQTYDAIRSAFERMVAQGYQPDFIIDAGASTGVWSFVASRVFPSARFVLVEPLLSQHDRGTADRFIGALDQVDICECALGATDGQGHIEFGTSVYEAHLEPVVAEGEDAPAPIAGEHREHVSVRTLDSLARELDLIGRGILKLDIQGGELDALRGGGDLLGEKIDAVVTEVTIDPPGPGAPSFADVDTYLRESGFRLFDDVGNWRDQSTGMLLEKDVLYVRRDLPIAQTRRLAGSG
jgi:FkbM family methyltransferase